EEIKEEEEEIKVKTSISEKKIGLKLNPEDFMIKQRPKKIVNVPKDAKKKLKTSAFGQVVNPPESVNNSQEKQQSVGKETTSAESEISDTEVKSVQTSISSQSPPLKESTISKSTKQNLEEELMDLKIKKAKISKMALDFEMQELSGEITTEELEKKKVRLEKLEKNIKDQISELEKLL
ncbi:MAG: hypothetical protein P8Y97_23565, partial [Candidatus Lokiarchaeota archaeon]